MFRACQIYARFTVPLIFPKLARIIEVMKDTVVILYCTAPNLHCPLYTGCGGPKIFTSYILYIFTISISHPNRKKAILTIVVANALY